MELLHWVHENVTRLHIAVGSCGLLLFWIPVITRKGNLNHKKFGRYFATVMYAVGFSGITVTTLDLLFPLAMHAPGVALEPARAIAVSREVRDFALFLFSISLLVLLSTRHGWLTVQGKEAKGKLKIINKNLIEDSKKNIIVMGRNTELSLEDDAGRQLAIYKVNYGSKIFFKDGDTVEKGKKIAE